MKLIRCAIIPCIRIWLVTAPTIYLVFSLLLLLLENKFSLPRNNSFDTALEKSGAKCFDVKTFCDTQTVALLVGSEFGSSAAGTKRAHPARLLICEASC